MPATTAGACLYGIFAHLDDVFSRDVYLEIGTAPDARSLFAKAAVVVCADGATTIGLGMAE